MKWRWEGRCNRCTYHVPDVDIGAFLQKISDKLVVTFLHSQMQRSAAALQKTQSGYVSYLQKSVEGDWTLTAP